MARCRPTPSSRSAAGGTELRAADVPDRRLAATHRPVRPRPGARSPATARRGTRPRRRASARRAAAHAGRGRARPAAARGRGAPRTGGRRWRPGVGRDLSLARLAEGHVDAVAILAEAGRDAGAGRALRRLGVPVRWRGRAARAAGRRRRAAGAPCGSARGPGCSTGRSWWRTRRRARPARAAAARRRRPRARRRARARQLVHGGDGRGRHARRRVRRRAPGLDAIGRRRRSVGARLVRRPPRVRARRGGGRGRVVGRCRGRARPASSATSPTAPGPRTPSRTSGELHAALAARPRAPAAAPPRSSTPRDRPGRLPDGRAIGADVVLAVATLRAAVERAVREVVDRAPRIVGPGPLSRDAELARRPGGPGALRPAAPRRARPRRPGRAGRRPVAHGVTAGPRRRSPGPSTPVRGLDRRAAGAPPAPVRPDRAPPGRRRRRAPRRRDPRRERLPAGPAPGRSAGHPRGGHRRRGRLPGLGPAARRDLGRVRRAELAAALRAQGLGDVPVHWLGLPDSGLADCRAELREALAPLLADADAYLAPWTGDPHPDHRAAGLRPPPTSHRSPPTAGATRSGCGPGSTPDDPAVPWDRAYLLELDDAALAAKRAGVAAFALPGRARARRLAARARPRRCSPTPTARPSCCSAPPRAASAPVSRFAALYADGADPWSGDSWYERRKRAVVLAEPAAGAVPDRVRAGLRDRRADRRAGGPVRRRPGVGPGAGRGPPGPRPHRRAARGPGRARPALPDAVPADPIDLAVFSEVLYYLDDATVARHAGPHAGRAASPGATWWSCTGGAGRPRRRATRPPPTGWCATGPSSIPLVEHTDAEFVLLVLRRR